jgi:hypothetical protein
MTAHQQFKPAEQAVLLYSCSLQTPPQVLLRNPRTISPVQSLHEDIRLPTQSGEPVAPRQLVDILDQVLEIVDDMANEIMALDRGSELQ